MKNISGENFGEWASSDGFIAGASLAGQLFEAGLSFSINVVSAICLLAAGSFMAGYASRLVKARLNAIERFDDTLIPVLAQVVRLGIMILVLTLVLAQFGVQTASIIAVLGAAGIAIGLALQGTLQNVAAGLMLLLLRPFKVGDFIETAEGSGTVDAIGLFMTQLHRVDNVFVAIPNSNIWAGKIVNYDMRPRRRMDLLVGISYDDDIDKAVATLKSLLANDERVFKRPEPLVVVKNLGDSSVDLEIRAWTKKQDYWPLRFDMTRSIKYELDRVGISIPYPHQQVVISRNGDQDIFKQAGEAA